MIKKFADSILPQTDTSAFAIPEGLIGLSGRRLVGTLQNFAKLFEEDPSACYLEVGVFKGLTLLTVASHVGSMQCFGVDNFSYNSAKPSNDEIVNSQIEALGLANVNLVNKDFEIAFDEMNETLGDKKIAVYFIDGPHDYRSQLMCLEYALPYLHENAIILVDDSNYNHVRQANRDFLHNHDEWKLLFEAYTPKHPTNMNGNELAAARAGWWNGVNIIVRDSNNVLKRIEPATLTHKTHFFNDHQIHGSTYADSAPVVLEAVQYLKKFRFLKALSKLRQAWSSVRGTNQVGCKRYFESNIDREPVSSEEFNPSIER